MTSLAHEAQKSRGFGRAGTGGGQLQAVKATALQRFLRRDDLTDLAPDLRYIALKYNQYFCTDVPCQKQDQLNQRRQINVS